MDKDFFLTDHLLENDRARLEPLTEAHYEKLLPIALQKDLWAFTSVTVQCEDDFRKYFNQALLEKKLQSAYPYAIYDKQNDRYAGSTRYGNIDWGHKRAEIGWTWYDPALQRSGINKNCKFLLLSFAFDKLDLNRVELKTSLTNFKSQGAMLKLGAVKEGLLRRHMVNWDGTLRDSVCFSFIKEEWPVVRQTFFPEFL